MTPRHRVSRTAIQLIQRFEGYRRKAAELPDGRWTIGHGHTLTARQGAEVSQDDAEALLLYDLIAVTHALNEAVFAPLTQNQFDALACFVFNIGLDNFRRSAVLKRLNEGALLQAACAMELWRKAEVAGERIVIDALMRRRAVEKSLFLTPAGDAWVAAPSPVLRPLLDTDWEGLTPRQRPAEVTTSMGGETVEVVREVPPGPAPAPPLEDETVGPSRDAAEAVTARLQTLFQEPDETTALAPAVHPENIPADPHPQADFGPPPAVKDLDDAPFTLVAHAEGDQVGELHDEPSDENLHEGPSGPDLFEPSPVQAIEGEDRPDEAQRGGDMPDERSDEVLGELDYEPPHDPLTIEEAEPFDFLKPMGQPLPEQPKGGLVALLTLAAVGLAFFAGGVFWATNVRPVTETRWLDPRIVGWLAGVAGVGFFVLAVYLLLERLGRTSEYEARTRR